MIPLDHSSSNPQVQMDIVVRRAKIDDWEAVWKLAQASTLAAHWEREAYWRYLTVETAADSQAKALFVACVCAPARKLFLDLAMGQIVGVAAFSAIAGFGEGESTLENMAVAGPWQRQGIGARLLTGGTLWSRAHANRYMFLEVRESNLAAIALYQRDGFRVVGCRPAYYSEPEEDALQMRKALAPTALGG
ncbi:MAG: GNAT family N-acetyltransferase [Acidobacteriaceae bacterium]